MINVIWIDDECKTPDGQLTLVGGSFVDEAFDSGIEITPFISYKEGIEALKKEPYRWNAVILDICNERATEGNKQDGFMKAYRDLEFFRRSHNCVEPYIFVFSGFAEFQDDEKSFIPKEDYARKRVYAKPDEASLLFKDINKVVNVSDLYRVKNKYCDIFNIAKEDLQCTVEEQNRLIEIIYKIEEGHRKNDDSILNSIRKFLEGPIMRNLFELGIPETTLNVLSRKLGKGLIDPEPPVYVQRSFHSLVEISQKGSHPLSLTTDVASGVAPYVLHSSMFELFNIITWIADLTKYCRTKKTYLIVKE